MIKAMIFDWDGVIVDSMPAISEGISATAKNFGVDISPEKVLDSFFQPREKYYKSIGVNTSDIEELTKAHKGNIVKYHKEPKLINDVENTLRALKDSGIILAIASTARDELIKSELKRFGINDIFKRELIAGGDVPKDVKLKTFSVKLDTQIENILYVGDLPSDVVAAKNAGAQSAGINNRDAGIQRLKLENPNYLFNSFSDLLSLI